MLIYNGVSIYVDSHREFKTTVVLFFILEDELIYEYRRRTCQEDCRRTTRS